MGSCIRMMSGQNCESLWMRCLDFWNFDSPRALIVMIFIKECVKVISFFGLEEGYKVISSSLSGGRY